MDEAAAADALGRAVGGAVARHLRPSAGGGEEAWEKRGETMVREVQDLVLREAGAPGGGQAPPPARRALLAAVHELRRARRGADGAGAGASGARDLATPVVEEVVLAASSASGSPPGGEPPAGEFPDAALVAVRKTVPPGPSSYSRGRPGPPPGALEAALEEALRRLPGAGDDDGDRLRALDAVLKLQGALASQRALQLQEAQLELQARKLGASLERNGLLSEANEVSSRRAEAAEVGLRARAALEHARREDARVVRFCKICADDILSGLLVMLAAVAAGARGRVASRVVFDACERRFWATRAASASSGLLDFLGLSAGEIVASFLPLEHLEYAACCAGVLVRLAGSFALLALLAAHLLRRGVTSDRWGAPSSALALLLATGCGYVGRLAVAGAGGARRRVAPPVGGAVLCACRAPCRQPHGRKGPCWGRDQPRRYCHRSGGGLFQTRAYRPTAGVSRRPPAWDSAHTPRSGRLAALLLRLIQSVSVVRWGGEEVSGGGGSGVAGLPSLCGLRDVIL